MNNKINRSTLYLTPIFQKFEDGFVNDIISFDKLYINDAKYINSNDSENSLFLSVNNRIAEKLFNHYGHIINDIYSNKDHSILVIEPMFDNKNWKKSFCEGSYSKIYSKNELDNLFGKVKTELHVRRHEILCKNPLRWNEFKNNLNQLFNGIDTGMLGDYDGRELDIPPILKEEILNYE